METTLSYLLYVFTDNYLRLCDEGSPSICPQFIINATEAYVR